MKKLLLILLASFSFYCTGYSQSSVIELEWYDVEGTYYHGLAVMYPNNQGTLHVRFYNDEICSVVAVRQNAVMNYQYGTSYLMCSYPQTVPYVPYAADNFVFYSNGLIYTQDYFGKWSTAVTGRVVPAYEWREMYGQFGL